MEVWLPFPVSDAHQTISQVSIDAPRPVTITREPEYGDSILYVRVDHPEQREIPVEVTFTAKAPGQVKFGCAMGMMVGGVLDVAN